MNRASIAILISVGLIFCMGLVMVFNTTAADVIHRSLEISTHAAMLRQAGYGVLGVVLGVFCYMWGYQNLLRFSPILLGMISLLLVLVFIPPLGQTINGARRWIGVGGFTFQPSESAKFLIPICFIQWTLLQKKEITFFSFVRVLFFLSVPLLLIFFEPDNGTFAIILFAFMSLFFLTKVRWSYWVVPLLIVIGVGAAFSSQMPHVPDRIRIYLHPELDLRGKGHQPYQAKIAAGSGQWLGRGLGESLQKMNYLPEARSDYIAAIFAEECGFVGIVGLIALYMIFCSSGFLIAIRAKESGGFLLAFLLTLLIGVQAFLNLGIVSGLLPSKGMTLPFFSQGGSSLVMNMISICVLLDIARKAESYHFESTKRY